MLLHISRDSLIFHDDNESFLLFIFYNFQNGETLPSRIQAMNKLTNLHITQLHELLKHEFVATVEFFICAASYILIDEFIHTN